MNQTVFDTSEICYLHGVRHAVFSPGSRNAPLSISFHRNKKINSLVIVDERSAGFIALGIAQQTGKPVVLCCTSGTALLNYGPAIAEAYYQGIPLIVLSADRPPEWIDHWDGQTIRQQNVFASYLKYFAQLPVGPEHADTIWDYQKKLREGLVTSIIGKMGPVHLNIPFREPFYPTPNQKLSVSDNLHKLTIALTETVFSQSQIEQLQKEWTEATRKLIVIGQMQMSETESKLLSQLSTQAKIPVIADVISNGHQIDGAIRYQDLFLQNNKLWKDLEADLIISFGTSVISKNLKLFLRSFSCPQWRINENPEMADPYQQLTRLLPVSPSDFLEQVTNSHTGDELYQKKWQVLDQQASTVITLLEGEPYSEFTAFRQVLEMLPESCDLHLGNSMPVRYANFIGTGRKDVRVFANRGTSGIDGTNGTAVGHALSTQRKTILLTGDLSFLYDTNAFFHEYDISNLYIMVFNNFGGGIFNLIPGPKGLSEEERERHFTTPHHKDMKLAATQHGLSYLKANDYVTLELCLADFFSGGTKGKVLEVQTNPKVNEKVYFDIKKQFNE